MGVAVIASRKNRRYFDTLKSSDQIRFPEVVNPTQIWVSILGFGLYRFFPVSRRLYYFSLFPFSFLLSVITIKVAYATLPLIVATPTVNAPIFCAANCVMLATLNVLNVLAFK